MNTRLDNVRRTLQELLRAVPAIKEKGCQEAMKKHVALIRFYQQQYETLALAAA